MAVVISDCSQLQQEAESDKTHLRWPAIQLGLANGVLQNQIDGYCTVDEATDGISVGHRNSLSMKLSDCKLQCMYMYSIRTREDSFQYNQYLCEFQLPSYLLLMLCYAMLCLYDTTSI